MRTKQRKLIVATVFLFFSFSVLNASAALEPSISATLQGTSVVKITGEGFAPDSDILTTFTFGDDTSNTSTTADSDGSFITQKNVPKGFYGLAEITSKGQRPKIFGVFGGGETEVKPTESKKTISELPQAASSPSNKNNVSLAANTWWSGASGDEAKDGSFCDWRGEPCTMLGTWNDATLDDHLYQWSLDNIRDNANIDNAVGGLYGMGWAEAANGGMDAHWTTAVKNAKAKWANKGVVYYRPFHEMNGNWYKWKVLPGDAENFKKAFARFAGIMRANDPTGQMVFGPNYGTSSGCASVESIWPGAEYVDVIGVDMYDMWPTMKSEEIWNNAFMEHDGAGNPKGLGAWLAYSKSKGVPMGIPEWGLNEANKDGFPVDNPLYIQKMNDFFSENAGSGPGQILYDVYYNINTSAGSKIFPTGHPNSSALYKQLSWGTGAGGATKTMPQSSAGTTSATSVPYLGPNAVQHD